MAVKDSKKRNTQSPQADDFKSVAKRLGCDPDMASFDAKLKKIVKTKPEKAKGAELLFRR